MIPEPAIECGDCGQSEQCCQLSARIPRESGIDRRKIDRRVIFKGLGKQSKIDVPLDRDRRTLGFPHDPFSISQNSLEGLKQDKNQKYIHV